MVDWKKLAKAILLADGKIDTREVNILRDSLAEDGKMNRPALEFIQELRLESKSHVKAFTELYHSSFKAHLLADGIISDTEAKWLRKVILSDKTVDADEKRLLEELKAEAKEVSPEFQALYEECMK